MKLGGLPNVKDVLVLFKVVYRSVQNPGTCGEAGMNMGRWAKKEQVLDRFVGFLEQN